MLFSFLASVASSESEKEFKENLQILVVYSISHENFVIDTLKPCLKRLGYKIIKKKFINEDTKPGDLYRYLDGIKVYILLTPPQSENTYSTCIASFYNILSGATDNLKLVIHSNLKTSSCTTSCLDILKDRKKENKWMVVKIFVENEEKFNTLETSLKEGMYNLLANVM